MTSHLLLVLVLMSLKWTETRVYNFSNTYMCECVSVLYGSSNWIWLVQWISCITSLKCYRLKSKKRKMTKQKAKKQKNNIQHDFRLEFHYLPFYTWQYSTIDISIELNWIQIQFKIFGSLMPNVTCWWDLLFKYIHVQNIS